MTQYTPGDDEGEVVNDLTGGLPTPQGPFMHHAHEMCRNLSVGIVHAVLVLPCASSSDNHHCNHETAQQT